jgi:hypothetical protein
MAGLGPLEAIHIRYYATEKLFVNTLSLPSPTASEPSWDLGHPPTEAAGGHVPAARYSQRETHRSRPSAYRLPFV